MRITTVVCVWVVLWLRIARWGQPANRFWICCWLVIITIIIVVVVVVSVKLFRVAITQHRTILRTVGFKPRWKNFLLSLNSNWPDGRQSEWVSIREGKECAVRGNDGGGDSIACFVPDNLITAPTDRQRVVMAVMVMVIRCNNELWHWTHNRPVNCMQLRRISERILKEIKKGKGSKWRHYSNCGCREEYIGSNWIKTVNSVLNAKSSRKYIATFPRIETTVKAMQRIPKESWTYGVRQRMNKLGQRERVLETGTCSVVLGQGTLCIIHSS